MFGVSDPEAITYGNRQWAELSETERRFPR